MGDEVVGRADTLQFHGGLFKSVAAILHPIKSQKAVCRDTEKSTPGGIRVPWAKCMHKGALIAVTSAILYCWTMDYVILQIRWWPSQSGGPQDNSDTSFELTFLCCEARLSQKQPTTA